MSDAMQLPQPMNEPSGPMAESILETPHAAYDGQPEAAPAESSVASSNENVAQPPAASDGPESNSPPSEARASEEFEAEVDIDWEAEVDAFVKAEAELDAAAAAAVTESTMACSCGASAKSEIDVFSTNETREDASGEIAANMDAACHCFAGAVHGEETGAAETPVAEETTDSASDTEEKSGEETIEIVAAGAITEFFATPVTGELHGASSQAAAQEDSAAQTAPCAEPAKPIADRRRRRRAMISAPVRVRGVNVTHTGPDEISTTIDVSRNGILFQAKSGGYYRGMEVAVIFPYSQSPTALHSEQCGRVVRVVEQSNGATAVAIALGLGIGEDLVDAGGRKLASCTASEAASANQPPSDKPLILVMDPDSGVRAALRAFLEMEGYQVIAVGGIGDARHVLGMCVPALVIAEIEGDALAEEGLPGYDLCAHIKETRRLRNVPVVLTTRSAYPSDYSNAHSLGAIVCMAKPYKQERVGNVVRLLAPLPTHKETPAVLTCKVDPKRKAPATPHAGAGRAPVLPQKYDENTNARRKFRFPSLH
ncbi:MAG TPA: response regulator [Candidatus Acidoferrum sp.]|nr:response regulator [Candidatus Acidoferrum sp.]